MRQLDGDWHVRPTPHALERTRKRRLRLVGPQPEVARRDPSLCQYGGRFDGKERGARQGEVTEVDEVPVGRTSLICRVLAHRRNDDAVLKFEASDMEWREKTRLRAHPSLCDSSNSFLIRRLT